jgi:ribonuclease J
LDLKKTDLIDSRRSSNFPDKNLIFLVAGFAAQANSALSKIVMGKHQVKIKSGDKVIFTAPDYIPGTTGGIYKLIDILSKMGAEVVYSGSTKDVIHVSGHGSQKEHALLINLTAPRHLLPIGGNYRHVKKYEIMAQKMGYKPGQILIPDPEQAVTFWANGKVDFNTRIPHRQVLVDGLGVGDVGHIVLRDRRTLSQNGIVIITMLVDTETADLISDPYVTTRGFVFEKESQSVLKEIEKTALQVFKEARSKPANLDFIRQRVQSVVEEQVYKRTEREPMVLPLIIEV